MKRSFFLLTLTFYTFQIANAQRTLAVRQVGLNTDTVPALTLMDDPNQIPERLNDSTIQFNVPPTGKECLFIVIDAGTRWFTRVWIDSTILHKELIINYSNIGDSFKEIALPEKNDSLFDSNTIKNKWILLDFWATTCGPCIKSMDAYVSLYKAVDTSKIEFISVSLDQKKDKWKNSETTNKIIWHSVWEEDNFYGNLCLNYNVYSIPFFILFDNEKKIVFIKDGADEIENIKKTLLSIK